MRAWQTSSLIILWGMAAGMLLWASGADIRLQFWLAAHYHESVDAVARTISDIGLGRNQILALLVVALGTHACKGHGIVVMGRGIVGAFVQLGLFVRGRFVWCAAWKNLTPAHRAVWAGIPIFAVVGVMNFILKNMIGRPRPKEILWNGTWPFDVTPFASSSFMSFPSGHTASTAAIATVLGMAFPAWRVPLVLMVAAVAVARVKTLTSHYAGDVVAGAALGWGVSWVICHKMGIGKRDA